MSTRPDGLLGSARGGSFAAVLDPAPFDPEASECCTSEGDTSERGTSERGTSERDTSERGTSERDTSERDTSERDTSEGDVRSRDDPARDGRDTNEGVWKSDDMVAQWVATAPERERAREPHRRLMADLLAFEQEDSFTFVDLGAGTGAASKAVLDRFPRARGILAEYSPQMAVEGRKVLASYAGRFTYVELDLNRAGWPSEVPSGVDAVISSLCVHHLPDLRKRALFFEIWQHLAPGGWYLNYDPVRTDDPVVAAAWLRAGDRLDPDAALKRRHRTPEEERRYENHIRYIAPLPIQLEYLRDAGFEGIDVYWKELDHVIYGGRRPLAPRSESLHVSHA
jgi:tRNA (cmo5U34)-methyltransferase